MFSTQQQLCSGKIPTYFSMNYFLLRFTPTTTERLHENEPTLSGARSSHAPSVARLVSVGKQKKNFAFQLK